MSKPLPALEGGTKTREDFLVYGSPLIEKDAIESVVETLRSGWIGTGPKTKSFEDKISKLLNVKHVTAVNSCTAALHLALTALDVKEGDEVIVPTYTFCATANSVLFRNAKPVFVDCDYDTLNMRPEYVKKAITKNTKAILPVHLAGYPVDMDPMLDLAKKHNLKIIEDAAHTIEGKYKGQSTGTIGDLGCYSFYVTKNITTAEGGAIVSNNDEYAHIAKVSSLHGLSADAWKRFSSSGFKHYEVARLGYKYNMTDLQAALGDVHIDKVYDYLKTREKIWQKYNNAFADLPVKCPPEIANELHGSEKSLHARHLYILRLDTDALTVNRDKILEAMQAEGIGCGIHYKPLHLHELYKNTLDYQVEDFSNANKLADEILSLPLSQKLSDSDTDDVINAFKKVIKHYTK